MLVDFTVKNYRSFKDERTFSMEACSMERHEQSVHEQSVINEGEHRLLPLAILYGANSSGKSNLIRAIRVMKEMVKRSVQLNEDDLLPYDPFTLDKTTVSQPTLFEIRFIRERAVYRYGFEYNRNEIISEWLYEKPFEEKEEHELFERSGDVIEVLSENFPEGEGKENLANKNRLFLSLVAQLKGEKSNSIIGWFRKCYVLSGVDSEGYEDFTHKMFLEHLDGADEAQDFFKELQLGFNTFSAKKVNLSKEAVDNLPYSLGIPKEVLKILPNLRSRLEKGAILELKTFHNIYDESGRIVREQDFHMDKMESEGTKKVIKISGPIFDSLNKGNVLIIDELDAKLHPLLTRNIVLLFMDLNKNNKAQLIFATHDTNLLDLALVRRDQIWFTEKDRVEATDVYSLVQFKNDDEGHRDVRRDYIRGRYGAVPFIGK
ncbi:abortive infection protein [Tannerella sp. oral taxon BU063 isolate Cell 5]|uniref:Abortive infection protein n=1 Tax=Tannerella sp. oral taxon BU063 isolate Cell 5 TaxID=1410950 RepID=W2CC34_9BACT|nr:abortive infection protein [Tannerella sp. oral taxon BU063 isolate Cell 5]